jgi:hypothetical protein
MRGEDHHAKVLIDLEDGFDGATRCPLARPVPLIHRPGTGHFSDPGYRFLFRNRQAFVAPAQEATGDIRHLPETGFLQNRNSHRGPAPGTAEGYHRLVAWYLIDPVS